MPTQKPRYTVVVDEDLLRQIDDFRFENRFPSRSAATLELIRMGIQQLEREKQSGSGSPDGQTTKPGE